MSCICRLIVLVLLLSGPLWSESMFSTPRETLDTYLAACQEGDYAGAEECYTRSSRKLVDNSEPRDPELLKASHQKLAALEFRLEEVNSKRAILWPNDEKVPPFFLRIQDAEEGWRIDYHFMANYIQSTGDGWKWRNKRIFKIWKSRE